MILFANRELSPEIVAAARRHFERSEHRAIDAYYRVRHTFDGNEVIVMYVSGYDDGAQPLFGNYCVLLMREEGKIIRVFQSTHSMPLFCPLAPFNARSKS